MADVNEFVRLLLDPVRLAVMGRAAEGNVDIDTLVSTFGADRRTVLEALGQLRMAGLVDSNNQLSRDALVEIADALPKAPGADPAITNGTWTPEEREVLERFFSGTRLEEIPSARSKRHVVLERLAQEFEPGVRYREAEVNFTLQLFYPDYAALRRYLVDESLMTRADGVYWRTGGRTV